MADTKISGLTAGDPAQATDQIPVNRGGTNFSVTPASIAALIPAFPGRDGDDGDSGPPGIQGLTGTNGIDGTIGPMGIRGIDGDDGDAGQIIPGPQGIQGAAGAAGADGAPGGPMGPPGVDGSDGDSLLLPQVSSGQISRSLFAPDATNWSFLGTISGTGVTVGPLIWTGQYQQIFFEYLIGGYNGGTPIGRILCGSASISTTALTNGNNLMTGVTLVATSVSVPGCPLAGVSSAIARAGFGYIMGASGAFKQLFITGHSGNPAVATSPTQFHGSSFFSDLGTNLPIQRLQLTVYDLVTSTAASAQTFTATTQLWAWGRFND